MCSNDHYVLRFGGSSEGELATALEAAGLEVRETSDLGAVGEITSESAVECIVCAPDVRIRTERELREVLSDDRDREHEHGSPPVIRPPTDADEDELVETVVAASDRARRFRDRSRLIERSPVGQCLVKNGRIAEANPTLVEMADRDRGALEGTPVAELGRDVDDGDLIGEWIETAVAGEQTGGRFEMSTAVGERLIVDSRWTAANSGDAVVGTLLAVTDRVERTAEYERESEMLRSLLENVPMSIYFKDRRSRHERVSHHMLCSDPDSFITNQEGKAHAHPDDIVGKTDFDLYAPSFAEEAVADDRRIMADESPVVGDIAKSTTNLGETIYTSTTKAPRYDDDGNVIGLVGVTMDVTARESHKHELERQNERLNEFTEVLTHDLRSPLMVAEGHLSLLEADATADDVHTHVDKCSTALDRMEQLIEEIRTFVLDGRLVDSPDAVDLDRVATTAWECVDTAAATLEVESDLTIRADEDRLRRVFENLYRNSLEHGRESGSESDRPDGDDVNVTISVGRLDDGFFVADDGPGIPEDQRDRVFDRGFTTGDDSTGFGLAIVANIADAHDWTVSVGDGVAGGARFEFTDVVRTDDADTVEKRPHGE
ncbi:sensor histidine kinase [Halomontanus rarus]|uniref:sensor histidine kinase n=1 Tax=Halomontanus rarus TaxID=3034020 RepID=UPI0023E86B1D|nr:PAS domain-containing sensor histidine kinase [Halovivax sp. TS33]